MLCYRATEKCNTVLQHYNNLTGAKLAADRGQTLHRQACTRYREQRKVYAYTWCTGRGGGEVRDQLINWNPILTKTVSFKLPQKYVGPTTLS